MVAVGVWRVAGGGGLLFVVTGPGVFSRMYYS